jgi:hypothetical protein
MQSAEHFVMRAVGGQQPQGLRDDRPYQIARAIEDGIQLRLRFDQRRLRLTHGRFGTF